MTTKKLPPLVEWAFFTVISFLAGLAAYYSFLFFIIDILLPLSLIMVVLRLDARYALLSLLATGLGLAAFSSPLAALDITSFYGFPGVIFGLLFKNNVSPSKNLLVGTASALICSSLSMAAIYMYTGDNPLVLGQEEIDLIREWFSASATATTSPYGLDGSTADTFIRFFGLFLPAMFYISTGTVAVLTYFSARLLLNGLRFPLPAAPAFNLMRFPWYTVWVLITGLLLTLLGDYLSLEIPSGVGKNIIFIYSYVSFFLGLSVASFYYVRIKVARPVKIIMAVFLAMYFPFSAALLVFLGAVEPVVNFRRLPEEQ